MDTWSRIIPNIFLDLSDINPTRLPIIGTSCRVHDWQKVPVQSILSYCNTVLPSVQRDRFIATMLNYPHSITQVCRCRWFFHSFLVLKFYDFNSNHDWYIVINRITIFFRFLWKLAPRGSWCWSRIWLYFFSLRHIYQDISNFY